MPVPLEEILSEFGNLAKSDIPKIVGRGEKRIYTKGEWFLREGEVNTALGYLVSGIVRYYYIDDKGDENTAMFIKEGEFFAEPESYHDSLPAFGYFQMETKAEILVFSRENYSRLTSDFRGMEHVFMRLTQQKLREQTKLFRAILTLEAKNAYLHLLKYFPSIVSQVPDHHLASYLGITKYSLSRIKKKIMLK